MYDGYFWDPSGDDFHRLLEIRRAGDVIRFHNNPRMGTQSIADHSWRVTHLVHEIWPEAPAPVLLAALYHDVGEHITGDVPAPTKWTRPDLSRALDATEFEVQQRLGVTQQIQHGSRKLVKIADGLELMFYCYDQLRCGNREAIEPFNRIRTPVASLIENLPPEWITRTTRIYTGLIHEWSQTGGPLKEYR